MEKDYFKYYKPSFLPALIIGLFIIVYLAKEKFLLSISILSIVTILIGFITEYLWKYPPFKFLFWVDDFTGRYEGKLIYKYRDETGELKTGELKHVKTISQTGCKVTVSSFTIKPDGTKSSLSVNKGMYIEKTEDDKHFRLIYSYLNEGSGEQDFPLHYGTEVVKFIKKGKQKVLEGYYYTNRQPFQTRGEFEDLKWVSNNNEHEF